MPSSIPYDHPSLVLGNIIDTDVLNNLQRIAGLQNAVDASHDRLNALIAMKRSLKMTLNELVGMGIKTKDIDEKINDVDESVVSAAKAYLKTKLKNEDEILKLRESIGELEIKETLESPIDFEKTSIKTLPLSSESLKLDAQYFSFEDSDDSESNIFKDIENFVKESTDNLKSTSGKLAKTASSQVFRQKKSNNLSGTLIITASCTHKNVSLLDPIVIDPDKAIELWNATKSRKILATEEAMKRIEDGQGVNEDCISLVTGASYGSSFVGMVHLLKNTKGFVNPSEVDLKKLQERVKILGWLKNETGQQNTGALETDINRFLNNQSVSAHISLIVMGSVPSIASNRLDTAIKNVSEKNGNNLKSEINLLNGSVEKTLETVETGSEKTKLRNNVVHQLSLKDQAIIKGLGRFDSTENKVMDINSLMTAFENYLTTIKKGDCIGTPLNFYIKKLSAGQIAKLWINKYYPEDNRKVDKQIIKD